MLVGAAFARSGNWQAFYYFEVALSIVAVVAVFLFVPANCTLPRKEQIWGTLETIDFLGIVSGVGFIVSGLLLLNRYYILERIVLIMLGGITGISFIAFLILGFKTDRGSVRPLVPFRLFRNRTIAVILVQNILFGAAFYSFSYYLPLSLQVVREMSEIEASAMQIPYHVSHGACSTVSALIILKLQKKGKRSYSLVFLVGFAVWTLAMVALSVDSEYRVRGLVAFLGALVGIGTGSTFQNSVMAISAQVDNGTKGVAIGLRNLLRFFGGALGTAISSVIVRNQLIASLPNRLNYLAGSTFSPSLSKLTEPEQVVAQEAYDSAIAYVFYTSAVMVGVCFLLCLLIKDNKTDKPKDEEEAIIATSANSADGDGTDEKKAREDNRSPRDSAMELPREQQPAPHEARFHAASDLPCIR